jgi:long-chain acyl-CoA synthetase
LFQQVLEATGITLLQGYGLSENSPVVSVNRDAQVNKMGSVGTAVDGVEVAIEKDGALAGAGTIGEVVLRGPSVMAGYHRDPELTAKALAGGWLHTRDLGYLDEDGYLFLTGRLQRMAIIGGFNVYPAELERVLLSHPGVAEARFEILEDPVYGESLSAAIRPQPGASVTAEELQSWCRRQMSAYKIPRRLELLAP